MAMLRACGISWVLDVFCFVFFFTKNVLYEVIDFFSYFILFYLFIYLFTYFFFFMFTNLQRTFLSNSRMACFLLNVLFGI